MPDEFQIARAMREGKPPPPLRCDGCGEGTGEAELTPHGKILCPGCREAFFGEAVQAVLAALKGDKLFGFVGEDEVVFFLSRELTRLTEAG